MSIQVYNLEIEKFYRHNICLFVSSSKITLNKLDWLQVLPFTMPPTSSAVVIDEVHQ